MKILPTSIAVIGSGLAGLRTAEQLRANGYTGTLTLIGREDDLPYHRPPLTKEILRGEWDPERATIKDRRAIADLDIEIVSGRTAVGLALRTVTLDDGSEVTPDAVVIATGAEPRRLPGQPEGVLTLRNRDDAIVLRDRLSTASSIVVVGGGFIGAEVATAALAAGVSVTILDSADQPCAQLGPDGGALVARLLREAGADLRTGVEVARFVDERTIELLDGEKVQGDVVLVSIGVEPDTSWLEAAGTPLEDGIICGSTGRIERLPSVWALGDVAAWWDQPRRRHVRSQHWASANDQAIAVATDILEIDSQALPLPYVWSEQAGLTIEVLGRPDLADTVRTLAGSGREGGDVLGTVLGYYVDENLVGVLAFGVPEAVESYREDVTAGTTAITVVAVPDEEG